MDAVRNDTRAGTLTIYKSVPGGMKVSDGSESYEAQFDGKDYPRNGDIHSTVALKLIDDYTMEETDKQDGKIVSVGLTTLAEDGKSMRVQVSNKQRAQTMTYTAVKLK